MLKINPSKQKFAKMKTRKETDSIPNNHKCAFCPHSTTILQRHKEHLKVHSDQKPFKCPECPYKTKWEHSVKAHVKNVHILKSPASRPFPCPHPGCSYAAKDRSKLPSHLKTHSDEKSFFCSSDPNCNYSTNDKPKLIIHTRTHTKEKPYVCKFESCSFSAATPGAVVTHTRTHTKEKPFKCSEPNCRYSATQIGHLRSHQLTHEPPEGEERPTFSCPHSNEGCPFTTHRKDSLRIHLFLHSDSFFKCDFCPFKAKKRGYVLKHVSCMHKEGPDGEILRPFKCPEPNCDYAAKVKGKLKDHVRIHLPEKSFKCPKEGCSFAANFSTGLRGHMKTHQAGKNFTCILCLLKFRDPKSLRSHIFVHTQERHFKCQVEGCSFATTQSSALKTHRISVHTHERRFPCQFPGCPFISSTSSSVSAHFKNVHSENPRRPFQCAIQHCPFAAKNQSDLKNHRIQVHSQERPFKCPKKGCSYPGAKTKHHLSEHIATHNKDKNQECPHDNCEFKTNTRARLLRHLKMRHQNQNQQRKFKCPLCEYTGKSKENLSSHIKRHTLEKFYKCDEPNCSYEGKTKQGIKQHKLVHSDEKNFACSVESCEYRCKSKNNLSHHLKTHSEERRYKCELCPFRGKTKKVVTSHLENLHSDPNFRPFKCTLPQCDYTSKRKYDLQQHLLTHLTEKKYSCSFPGCDYRATSENLVKGHQMRIHEMVAKYKCGLCKYTTSTKSYLTTHVRTHTKEEPYVCKLKGCGYRVKQPSALKQHHPQN